PPPRRSSDLRPLVVTSPRIVVRGATLAITRRTTLRKAFLAPWDPRVEQAWLYALADAQRETKVAVHHGVRVITHHHASITLTEPNLGEFLRRFTAMSAALSTPCSPVSVMTARATFSTSAPRTPCAFSTRRH